MRQGTPSKRGRNRSQGGGRRGYSNPMNRTYDSNGPDVKVRGTAMHIYDKYLSLARDATSSGDTIASENYLQHAEHYYRIMAAYNAQQSANNQPGNGQPASNQSANGQPSNNQPPNNQPPNGQPVIAQPVQQEAQPQTTPAQGNQPQHVQPQDPQAQRSNESKTPMNGAAMGPAADEQRTERGPVAAEQNDGEQKALAAKDRRRDAHAAREAEQPVVTADAPASAGAPTSGAPTGGAPTGGAPTGGDGLDGAGAPENAKDRGPDTVKSETPRTRRGTRRSSGERMTLRRPEGEGSDGQQPQSGDTAQGSDGDTGNADTEPTNGRRRTRQTAGSNGRRGKAPPQEAAPKANGEAVAEEAASEANQEAETPPTDSEKPRTLRPRLARGRSTKSTKTVTDAIPGGDDSAAAPPVRRRRLRSAAARNFSASEATPPEADTKESDASDAVKVEA